MKSTNITPLIQELVDCCTKGEFIEPKSTFAPGSTKQQICPMTGMQKAMYTLQEQKMQAAKDERQKLVDLIKGKSLHKAQLTSDSIVPGIGKMPAFDRTGYNTLDEIAASLNGHGSQAYALGRNIMRLEAEAKALKAMLHADLFTALPDDSNLYRVDISKDAHVVA